MGVLKGLKSIQDHNRQIEDRKAASENRVKATWLSLQDGESVRIRFLQELDEDSETHSDKNGVGFLAVEHTSPKDYRRKAVCTADEGGCYACDQARAASSKEERAPWRQKTRLYINVLVDNGKDDPYVAILSQGTSGKSITPTLLEFALENGQITNRWWKVKRTGKEMSNTSYSLIPFDAKGDLPSIEDYEVFDLEKAVIRNVPLAEQSSFYNNEQENAQRSSSPEPAGVSASDIW